MMTDEQQPDYKAARGAFNWQPGDEPAEQTVRRIRDGGDSDALTALRDALRETTDMLDQQAAKVFVMGEGHRHWDGVQALIDKNRAMLNADPIRGDGDAQTDDTQRLLIGMRLDALEAENAALRDVLKPIAVTWDEFLKDKSGVSFREWLDEKDGDALIEEDFQQVYQMFYDHERPTTETTDGE